MKKAIIKFEAVRYIIAVLVLASMASCSNKMTFVRSGIVPAATGSVSLKSDNNGNHTIKIDVNHLAPAASLNPDYKTYVVWMVTQSNETKNIGQLKSSTSVLSKALKGSLNAVSSFKPNSFFITAEREGNVEYPGMTVLSTK